MADQTILKGRVLSFTASPFEGRPEDAVQVADAVAIADGQIAATGSAETLRAEFPDAAVVDHGDKVIMAGFIDAHVHYPQTAMIASWGKRLIDWLNSYTFPEEMKFSDASYAAEIAGRYLDLTTAHGTSEGGKTWLPGFAPSDEGPVSIEVLGPVAAPLARLANRTRYQLMLLARSRRMLHAALARLAAAKLNVPRDVRWSIDVDPYDSL